ncbi:DUF4129 domain-containing protein [Halorussus pelagicus]|uniref:DUF4129 domain-containing protein n=1 Tax=Halorussus pelagicus TaxID=2505977 RepID=UPI001FB6337C|nr:DUF4129 domain-containing protein [Halorussus pelagicus]
MSRERRRAALAALCVLAVALAATLLPASGFGSQPAGVGVGGDAADAPGGGGTDAPRQTTEATAPPATTAQDAETTTSDGGDETTTTTTTTATTTTTGTAPSGSSPFAGADLFVTAATGLFGLVGLLALVGFSTGVLEVSSRAAGALPFTLTIGGTPLGALVGRIPARTMATIVALSSSVPRLLDDAASLAGAVGRSLGSVLGAAGRGTAEAFRIGAKGLALTVTSIPRALAGLSAGLGVFSGLGNVSMPSLGRGGSDDGDDRNRSTSSDEQADPVPPTVEEAWETMRDRVPVRNRRARTPGEVARAAARRGFPDEAVRRLTDSFREVRYGDLPRDERTDSARSALDRLRDYWRGDEK